MILPRIANGDSTAVPECVARYGKLVWTLAHRFLSTPVDAEDATQDIFVDLWKNAARFNPLLASEPAFITMVARRRLIDRLRRGGPMRVSSQSAEGAGYPDDAQQQAEMTDEANRVSAALAEFHDEQQRVIVMAIYDGLAHEEIAARTGIPLGTIRTQIRHGLLRIRELLSGGES